MALPYVSPAMCVMMKDAVYECDPKGQVTTPVENAGPPFLCFSQWSYHNIFLADFQALMLLTGSEYLHA